jgi:hypothetical protein
MAGNKDPLVQEFLDMIKAGSQPAGPDSEFASGRFMDDPPMLSDMDDPATRRDETDPLEMGMLSGRDRRDMSKTMPTRTERSIMATEPGQDVENIQMAAAGDFPTPSEMQDAAQPQGTGLFGAQGVRNTPIKEETAQLLEEKPEVKEEPVDEIKVETKEEKEETPEFIYSQPVSFEEVYSNATSPLSPEAQKAFDEGYNYVKAYYDFMDKNFDTQMDLNALTQNVDSQIKDYTNKIDEIAQEEISPPFEGDTMRKVLAVIGAALGAAASTFGGTPNYALQIIDKAIDREQQRKLKSKEMRMLSAREQRRILQEQRGQMLQFALNKTNQAIQASQMKGQAAQSLASLQMMKAQLEEAKTQNMDRLAVDLIKTQINAVMLGLQFQAKNLSKQQPRMVEAFTITGPDKQPIQFTPFMAKTEKEAIEIRKYKSTIANANKYLDKLEPLLQKGYLEKLKPAAFSQTRKDILFYTAELEKEFKNQAGFGANYAEREIRLNEQTLPSVMDNTTLNILFGAEKSIAPLREKLKVTYLNKISEHGGMIFNPGMSKPKDVPGVQKVAD